MHSCPVRYRTLDKFLLYLLGIGSIKHYSEVQPGLTDRALLANSPQNSRYIG